MMAPETMVRKALVGEPTVCFERGDLFWSVFQGLGSWVESLKLLDIRRERAVCRRRADSVSFLGDSRSGCLCGEESKTPPAGQLGVSGVSPFGLQELHGDLTIKS